MNIAFCKSKCYNLLEVRIAKKFISISLVFIFVFSFCGCAGMISTDDATALVEDFWARVKEKNYEAAEIFLHPERPTELKDFFESVEEYNNIDFSNTEIKKYTGFKSVSHDSTVNGATINLTMVLSVSGKEVEAVIEIVRNNNGYGIYNLDLDFNYSLD